MPGLEIMGYKVFGNDFTDVDFCEELCHHAELYKSFFFGFSQSISFLAFMIGQDNFFHWGDEPEVVSGEVKDAGESEVQFLCRPEFPFVHEAEQIFLYFGSRHILEGNAGEVFLEVAFAHAFVFLICTGFNRLLFEGKPLRNVVGEEDGLQRFLLRGRRCRRHRDLRLRLKRKVR